MFSFFRSSTAPQSPNSETKKNQRSKNTSLKIDDFELVDDEVDNFELVDEEVAPSAAFLNNQSSIQVLSDDYQPAPRVSDLDDETIHFTEISNLPPTAHSLPLSDLSYDSENPLGNSSHSVFQGKDVKTNDVYFIKYVNPEMAYVEAFMGHIYELSLLHGVGRAYVRYDSTHNPKMSSKGLRHFKTFKDGHITNELLGDAEFRTRFIRIMAVMFRGMEDDFHRGNLTMPDKELGSPGLQVFDADCSYWPATYKVKGPRPNVDNVLPINRNPDTAFKFSEEDILSFPNFIHANPWYFPSRENPLSSVFSTNPWPSEDVAVVQNLDKNEIFPICFEEFIDWMLDLSIRFPSIAALNIPHDLTVPETGENVIDLYCKVNKEINDHYWNVLPKLPGFADFIDTKKESILLHILTRSVLRNMRLIQEQEQVLSNPDKSKVFSDQFDGAIINTMEVINKFNELIEKVNQCSILPCESMMATMMEIKAGISKINHSDVAEIIHKAKETAEEMFELEKREGTEDWRIFDKFDYQYKLEPIEPARHCSPARKYI